MSTTELGELETAIIDFLDKNNCEHKTREVISQVKSTTTSSTSDIRSAILSLIDEERVELTSDLSLKLHKE